MEKPQLIFLRIPLLLSLFWLIIMLNTGCSSSRPVLAKYHDNFNFSQVSSYRFHDRNSTFTDLQNISDGTRNSIELAIEQVLDQNNFVYQLAGDADIIVTYHLINQKAKELAQYNKEVGYCSYCLRGGTAPNDNQQHRIVPGSLILDIVSTKQKQSVWRSVYELNIEQDNNSKEVQLKIYQAIAAMMQEYPHTQVQTKHKALGSR